MMNILLFIFQVSIFLGLALKDKDLDFNPW